MNYFFPILFHTEMIYMIPRITIVLGICLERSTNLDVANLREKQVLWRTEEKKEHERMKTENNFTLWSIWVTS